MKVIDLRNEMKRSPLILSAISHNMVFEFVDKSHSSVRSIYLRAYVSENYLEREDNSYWTFDLVKGKLCRFKGSRKVTLLDAEFHIIGELNG